MAVVDSQNTQEYALNELSDSDSDILIVSKPGTSVVVGSGSSSSEESTTSIRVSRKRGHANNFNANNELDAKKFKEHVSDKDDCKVVSGPSNNVSNATSTATSAVATPNANSRNGDVVFIEESSTLQKVDSVQRDAKEISTLVNVDINKVSAKLYKVRENPSRVDLVTNELLEESTREMEILPSTSGIVNNKYDVTVGLIQDTDKVKAEITKIDKNIEFDPNVAYTLLESNADKENRVELVVNTLIKTYSKRNESSSAEKATEQNIFKEIEIVVKQFPKADPNHVYALLECRLADENRLNNVKQILAEKYSDIVITAVEPSTSLAVVPNQTNTPHVLDENIVASDPLYKDMLAICKMFPSMDKNEVYALCEVYHDRPNRIQLVTEELLGNSSQSTTSTSQEAEQLSTQEATVSANQNAVQEPVELLEVSTPLSRLQKDVAFMQNVFLDCDPDFLYQTLESMGDDAARVETLSNQMFENRNYPKLKDRMERDKREARIRSIKNMTFKMEEFLQAFPQPVETFYDETKAVTDAYREHAQCQLKVMFPTMHVYYILEVLKEHKDHFTPVLRILEANAVHYVPGPLPPGRRPRGAMPKKQYKKIFRHDQRRDNPPFPDIPDEYFYKELMFTRHEQEIKDYITKREEDRRQRIEAAKESGSLYECTCCYDDEVLFEDMLACPEGHLFCRDCVKRSAEANLGESKTVFPCLDAECNIEFTTVTLQKVLSSQSFSMLLRKTQEEELRKADIPDLVSCPFCHFATIMPDENDKVFKCLNPECLRESCRLCQEANHVPLRCDEVEKKEELGMRTFIENKMTEAMIRTCWSCKKRFFKTEGCNKMTCPCGASMCYVCQKPIKDYNHFNESPACQSVVNTNALHEKEAHTAGNEAKKAYMEKHPELHAKELKHDPLKNVSVPQNNGPTFRRPGDYVIFEDADESDGDDNDYDDDDMDSFIASDSDDFGGWDDDDELEDEDGLEDAD